MARIEILWCSIFSILVLLILDLMGKVPLSDQVLMVIGSIPLFCYLFGKTHYYLMKKKSKKE